MKMGSNYMHTVSIYIYICGAAIDGECWNFGSLNHGMTGLRKFVRLATHTYLYDATVFTTGFSKATENNGFMVIQTVLRGLKQQ